MLRPGIVGMRGSMVIRLRPCIMMSTPPPPSPRCSYMYQTNLTCVLCAHQPGTPALEYQKKKQMHCKMHLNVSKVKGKHIPTVVFGARLALLQQSCVGVFVPRRLKNRTKKRGRRGVLPWGFHLVRQCVKGLLGLFRALCAAIRLAPLLGFS